VAGDNAVHVQDTGSALVDTSDLVVAGQDVQRQRVVIADPATAAGLAPVTAKVLTDATAGLVVRHLAEPALPPPDRSHSGRVLFVEDFRGGATGVYNDGCGSAHVDPEVMFNGLPSLRLDPQGNSSTSSATGGNQQLTLGGSAATYTVGGSGTLVGTTTQAGSPAVDTGGGYIVLNTPSSSASWPTTDGNSYVLTYASAVISGGSGAWTVTFSGVGLAGLPGAPGTSVTTANQGTAVMAACNPNPNGTGSPLTSGVVAKRRICDQFSGRFGHAVWLRPTSKSAATSFTSVVCVSLYNRNGTAAVLGRMMIQTAVGMNPSPGWNNDNQLLWYVTPGTPVGFKWVPFAFLTRAAFNQHSYDPAAGSWDAAGGWHYAKIVCDFATGQYVSIQFNEQVYTSMAGVPMYSITPDSGAKMMHFSVELAMAQSATRRYWNTARWVGTVEP